MSIRCLLPCLLILLIACSEGQAKYPILEDEDKMVDIIVDMYIAESTVNKQPAAVRDSLRESYRDNIILIHDLSGVEFDSLFLHVQTDAESYKSIHKQVVNKLNDLNTKLNKD